jgi:hypothetical protein
MLAILFQEYGLRFLENTGLPGGIRYGAEFLAET